MSQEQPKCQTCEDTEKKHILDKRYKSIKYAPPEAITTIPCPDCQQPSSEFVKECRETELGEWSDWRIKELCDRLDTAEAINKDLLEACEPFARLADMIPKPDAPDPQWQKFNTAIKALPLDRYREARVAIAKAKKER